MTNETSLATAKSCGTSAAEAHFVIQAGEVEFPDDQLKELRSKILAVAPRLKTDFVVFEAVPDFVRSGTRDTPEPAGQQQVGAGRSALPVRNGALRITAADLRKALLDTLWFESAHNVHERSTTSGGRKLARVARAQIARAPVLEAEWHLAILHPGHLRSLAVDEAEAGAVFPLFD